MSAGLPGQVFREGRVSVRSWLDITGLAGRRIRVVGILGDGTGVKAWCLAGISGVSGRGMVRQKGRVEAGAWGPQEAPNASRCESGQMGTSDHCTRWVWSCESRSWASLAGQALGEPRNPVFTSFMQQKGTPGLGLWEPWGHPSLHSPGPHQYAVHSHNHGGGGWGVLGPPPCLALLGALSGRSGPLCSATSAPVLLPQTTWMTQLGTSVVGP